jgi:deoxyribonuclease (pyrimidine dimer)
MTRINIIPPSELLDQHLIAEYREIRLLTASIRRSRMSKTGLDKKRIPKQFTLNSGHIRFFWDKGTYIAARYKALQDEMRKRGFEPQFPEIDEDVWPEGFKNDWQPSEKDFAVIRERITLRVSQKPKWYRYYGKYIES